MRANRPTWGCAAGCLVGYLVPGVLLMGLLADGGSAQAEIITVPFAVLCGAIGFVLGLHSEWLRSSRAAEPPTGDDGVSAQPRETSASRPR